jgi:hypothetical protein
MERLAISAAIPHAAPDIRNSSRIVGKPSK